MIEDENGITKKKKYSVLYSLQFTVDLGKQSGKRVQDLRLRHEI